MKMRARVIAMVGLLIVAVGQACAKGPGGGGSGDGGYYLLSTEEAQSLLFLREEEKLARDLYTAFYEKWGTDIFTNIAASEQRHMDAVKNLLDSYRLDDPARQQAGEFTNGDLQAAYDALAARGMRSLLDALQVGGYVEELDISDLRAAQATTSRGDILQVYDNLMRGSRNHLRAFAGQIESRGVAYEAQLLPQDEVDAIIDSPMERGN